ncbi:S-adenosylmethionine:tRNA ribosyltransferase-isomerase [Verrucomicrobia bacterium]|nr:S-adenosylmethionine:tRNA ribosyltransferase-isomerase [Verrucomicrobiota bacterium]
MRTADFDFELPADLIAQEPPPRREDSRLLVLHRSSRQIEHRRFIDLPEYLRPEDVLVLNNSRVIPARLRGANVRTAGQFEILLLEETATNDWWAMLRPAKRAPVETRIQIRDHHRRPTHIQAIVLAANQHGHRRLRFEGVGDIAKELSLLGEVPLPPYIKRPRPGPRAQDRERYQTVFALPPGSVAAPTAGLHFTESLLNRIRSQAVHVAFVTLHVGLGTFAPVKSQTLAAHTMHEERYELKPETAELINRVKGLGSGACALHTPHKVRPPSSSSSGRVIAVGTTTLRVLESLAGSSANPGLAATPSGRPAPLAPCSGRTRIFIYPPYDFKLTDALLTNFHLPRSTLLMLVSAFAAPNESRGRELVLAAYAEAVSRRYRFFSYGDAMLIL